MRSNLLPTLCDAIVVETPVDLSGDGATVIMNLLASIRSLPDMLAMDDGRKWKSLPVIVVSHQPVFEGLAAEPPVLIDEGVYFVTVGGDFNAVYESASAAVIVYRQQLLAQFDESGFLITFDHGRSRITPAISTRDRRMIETDLYYGPADRRKISPNTFWTIDREPEGLAHEIEVLKSLIDDPEKGETDLQRFIRDNPHFWTMGAAQARRHLRFPVDDPRRQYLEVDFLIEPIFGGVEAGAWEVLEMKRAQYRVLAGESGYARLSAVVTSAIAQVREYSEHLEDPEWRTFIDSKLGYVPKNPRRAVLIGRMPSGMAGELFRKQRAYQPDVRIVTYDEVVWGQESILN